MKTRNVISKKIENRLRMYAAVLSLCNLNLTILALFDSINNVFLNFKSLVGETDSLVQQKLLLSAGLAKDKAEAKKLLIKLMLKIGGALHSYGYSIHDNVIMSLLRHTKSNLSNMRDLVFLDMCNNYKTLAATHAADLIDFGIDATMQLTFVTAINLFADKNPKPLEAKEHGKTLTAQLKAKDKETSDLLKFSFDKVVLILEPANPVFVADYFNARTIFDHGMRHEKETLTKETPDEMGYMTGIIRDKQTLDLLEAATVTFTSNSSGLVYTFETDEEGEYFADGLLRDLYNISVEYPSYITQVLKKYQLPQTMNRIWILIWRQLFLCRNKNLDFKGVRYKGWGIKKESLICVKSVTER